MAPRKSAEGSPNEQPKGTPRDLHPTSDIRFVMTEVAKLTERIDNLIERFDDLKADGKETRDKIGQIENSISSFKGGIKVFGGVYTFILVVVGALLAWFLRPSATMPVPAKPVVTPLGQASPPSTSEGIGAAEATPNVGANAAEGDGP